MKILVLGSSGQIGNAIVRTLVERGHDVTAAARRTDVPQNLADLRVRYQTCDIGDSAALDAVCAGHEVVVDAAAPYAINLITTNSESAKAPLEFAHRRMDHLIGAARRHGASLIHVSSAHAEKPRRSDALWGWQRRLVRAVYPYFAMKRLMEDRVRAAIDEGLGATILRPTACLGPWDIKPRRDCWIPKLLAGEIPGILSHRVNVMDTRDLAEAVAAAAQGTGSGETILLGGHNTTTDELIERLCESGGVRPPRLRIPAELSVVPLLWIEAMWAAIGTASPLPSLVAALLCEEAWIDQSEFSRRLGHVPRPLSQTANDTVSWYRTMGYC